MCTFFILPYLDLCCIPKGYNIKYPRDRSGKRLESRLTITNLRGNFHKSQESISTVRMYKFIQDTTGEHEKTSDLSSFISNACAIACHGRVRQKQKASIVSYLCYGKLQKLGKFKMPKDYNTSNCTSQRFRLKQSTAMPDSSYNLHKYCVVVQICSVCTF